MRDQDYRDLLDRRAWQPERVAAAASARRRRSLWASGRQLLIIAADHPARGMIGVTGRPMAMANRADLLNRVATALSRPGVDGVLGTPDVIEDLLLLGLLDDKIVIGSMNRGGLQGSVFEFDDRFTAYTAEAIARMGFDGGKMLCRIGAEDRATADTLANCAQAVTELAERGLMAMVEPFWSQVVDGVVRHDLSPEGMIRAISVAQALGATSARTWLKVPVVPRMEQIMAATTLPTLLLGGDPAHAPDEVYAAWAKALRLPPVRGLVAGRALLYPPGDDVAAAVDTAVGLLEES
ncbi:aldolase [Acrocarpospora phusangensis]|uniref:Aldolase n=1 Tax=Acrocarpospora phusangensis TaxID=1070424 RepID=A0A919USB5_9ACTN|nr:deoxyribose-phosphate aldolase [Acrocarpospora phusangensis]GIH28982.1 aldolase [Acrocarpospora phusangensis]